MHAHRQLYSAIVSAPFGAIGIRSDSSTVQELVYLPPSFAEKAPTDQLAERVARQIETYFSQPDFIFDLPLATVGSEFQRRVWTAISNVPNGSVTTYGVLARQLGSAARAVGQACGANWFPLVIPCHRVTAAAGLGGFAGDDDDAGFHVGVKRWLLQHEGVLAFA